jgi:cytoskeleton protein RodZ
VLNNWPWRFRAQENSQVASFGAQLRQEREKQKVTLDDISLTTKISTRMLHALEEEHFDQLPGGIFNKGFIRAYARCLGMDEEQVIADYLATISPPGTKSENDDQAPVLEPPSREEFREKNDGPSSLPWGALAAALLVVALGFTAWSVYSRESQKETPASTTPPANSTNPSPAAVVDRSPSPTDSAATAELVKPGSQPTPTPPATPPVSSADQSPHPTPRPEGFVVVIKAREDSWLSVSIDGEVSTHGILTAAAEKSVRAAHEVTIKAGNIGALDFEFNGQKLPLQGGSGEVKTLTFDAHGLRPPAPQPEGPNQLP